MPKDHFPNKGKARLDGPTGPEITVEGRDPGTGYIKVTRCLCLPGQPRKHITWETTASRLYPS